MTTAADIANMSPRQRMELLTAFIQGAGVHTLVADLTATTLEIELNSRDRATADAWAEIASALRIAGRTADEHGPAAMSDFAPVTGR